MPIWLNDRIRSSESCVSAPESVVGHRRRVSPREAPAANESPAPDHWPQGLRRFPEIREDITFIVEGIFPYCSSHLEYFLSSRLCAQAATDGTFYGFYVETPGAIEAFGSILSIVRGERFSMDWSDCKLYCSLFQDLAMSTRSGVGFSVSTLKYVMTAFCRLLPCISRGLRFVRFARCRMLVWRRFFRINI
jgi:hypothetical protein